MVVEKRIPRVKILEKDFPANIPDNIEDSYLEVIDQEGKTLALFFLYNSLHRKEFSDGKEFAEYYDDIMTSYGKFEEEDIEEIRDICGFDDNEDIPISYEEAYDKRNNSKIRLNEVFLSYGRLAFPYELDNSMKEEYEGNLQNEFRFKMSEYYLDGYGLSDYVSDYIDILNFYYDLYNVKEDLAAQREIFNEDNAIEHFLNLDIEILSGVANHLFSKDNINKFIDAANSTGKTEKLAFLLEYQKKLFNTTGDE